MAQLLNYLLLPDICSHGICVIYTFLSSCISLDPTQNKIQTCANTFFPLNVSIGYIVNKVERQNTYFCLLLSSCTCAKRRKVTRAGQKNISLSSSIKSKKVIEQDRNIRLLSLVDTFHLLDRPFSL